MAHRLPTEIEPGELRHRIKIAQPSQTTGGVDDIGGISQDPSTWDVIRTCWASIEAWTGDANLQANQQLSTSSHWIVIRNPRVITITSKMVVWFATRTFQINAVLNPTEQNKLLVLVCEEINQSQSEAPTPAAT